MLFLLNLTGMNLLQEVFKYRKELIKVVGFNHVITFNNNGKVTNYQHSYNKNNAKKLTVFLPLNFNNKRKFTCNLSVAVTNTYPTQIEVVEGIKSETDLNCYEFDVTQLYLLNARRRFGLCKIKLLKSNGRTEFESEAFKL